MARFMSGEENMKYDRITDTAVLEEVKNMTTEMHNQTAQCMGQTISRTESMINSFQNEIFARYDEQKDFYDTHKSRLVSTLLMYMPILISIMVSAPMRFLNYFCKWYIITIVDENRFESKDQCRPVWCIIQYKHRVESWDYYNTPECWKHYRAEYKAARKKLKEYGIKLSEVKIDF